MNGLLIKNGTVATADAVFAADVRCRDGRVSQIAPELSVADGEQVLDAQGQLLVPGGVDPHTHMDLDVGSFRAVDDFRTGTIAAACGGTTTIIDHLAFGPEGASIFYQIDAYHQLADGKAVVDYAFHGVVDRVDDGVLADLAGLLDIGVTSLKIYMTYDRCLDDCAIIRLLERTGELGILVCAHCETDAILQHLRQLYASQGLTDPIYHAKSRPDYCESAAVAHLLSLAHAAGDAPIYVVHTSARASLAAVAALPFSANVILETCPQYLLLDEGRYLLDGHEALKYILSPPLRTPADNEALWQALADGRISTIGTDHCPFFFARDKMQGAKDFRKCPNGIPGVELRMAQLYSEGVAKGRISLERYVQLTSTGAAQAFGLYPRKGAIAVGSDADICLIDPQRQVTVTQAMLHENVDYTPYEGQVLSGWPSATVSRGELIAQNGEFVGTLGRGEYLHCRLP
ncbi:MAG: dihydropyrimidinase [Actinomycetia bacterium]|nr:dihydropyrimidinase [Actinomycetes bacterium]